MKKYIKISFDDWYKEPHLFELSEITEDELKKAFKEDFEYLQRYFKTVDGAFYMTAAQANRTLGVEYGAYATTAIIDPESKMHNKFGRAQETVAFHKDKYKKLLEEVGYEH
jgi:hypothetical protein